MLQFTQRRLSKRVKYPNCIREYRLRAGLSQRRLGEMIGKRRAMVSSWERGQSLPELPNAFLLARALNTLAESLYAAFYFPRKDEDPNGQGA